MSNDRSRELTRWLESQRELSLLMAHDVRNPLAALFANLNYLELTCRPEDKDALEAIADLKLSADGMLRLIDYQVAIARLEAGDIVLDPSRPFAASASIRSAFDRAVTLVRSAGIELEYLDGAPKAEIVGDIPLFELMIETLVSNVSQHLQRGEHGKLATEVRDRTLVIVLTDDGPSFGSADQAFSRDGQLEMKKINAGRYSRGLGLYVIGLIASAMNARLESMLVAGKSQLVISIPIATT